MAKDPDIMAADGNNCLSIDPHTDPSVPVWLSLFVVMNNDGKDENGNPDASYANDPNPGFAQQGKKNKTAVTVTWKSECTFTIQGQTAAAVFELYAGDPSAAMTFGNTANLTPSPKLALTSPGTKTIPVTWTPSNTASDPNGPGHKCLVARCFPFGTTFLTPLPAGGLSAYVSEDPHYAQHNLTIDVTDSPMGGSRKIPVHTGNASKERIVATIHVDQDLQPNAGVLRAILPGLNTVPAFRQIATTPVRHMSLDFSAFNKEDEDWDEIFEHIGHVIKDSITGLFGHKQQPNIQARFPIAPDFNGVFTLNVDVTGSNAGDAHILHLKQTDQAGNYQGGLTVAIVTG